MKKALAQAPLFRLLLPFMVGIWAGYYLLPGRMLAAAALCLFTAALLAWLLIRRRARVSAADGWLAGLSLFIMLSAMGIFNIYVHRSSLAPGFFYEQLKPGSRIGVEIISAPRVKPTATQALAEVKYVLNGDKMLPVQGRVMLSFANDSNAVLNLRYGSSLNMANNIAPAKGPRNPGEFNYARYLATQDVYYTAWLNEADWQLLPETASGFWPSIYTLRGRVQAALAQALPDNNEKGIAEALVLGDESDIPSEVMADYAGTGTLHILSVSGLHVAIIVFVLNYLFSWLLRYRYGKTARMMIVLLLLWAYAFFTGFSPAMARSVIMYSVFYTGLNMPRGALIYNSLCAAALVLLLLSPLNLFQAGFQLSFLALLGILWLQPYIEKWYTPHGKWTKKAWLLISASLAAQAATLPLSVLYFNQVSWLFLPANLIVIPASYFVLAAGIAFVLCSVLPWAGLLWILGKILWLFIFCLNKIVGFINSLPGAHWQGAYVSGTGAWLLFAVIAFAALALIYKSKRYLIAAMCFTLIFLVSRNMDIWQKNNSREMNVLALGRKHTAITCKDNNRLYVLADSAFLHDAQAMKNHVLGYAWQNYISANNIIPIPLEKFTDSASGPVMHRRSVISFYDKAVAAITPKPVIIRLPAGQKVQAVLLQGNPRISLQALYKICPFEAVIAAGDNYPGNISLWQAACIENNIPFINLQTDESFSLHL